MAATIFSMAASATIDSLATRDDELFRDVGNDIFVFGVHLKHDQIDDFEGGAGPGNVIRIDKHVFKSFAAVQLCLRSEQMY